VTEESRSISPWSREAASGAADVVADQVDLPWSSGGPADSLTSSSMTATATATTAAGPASNGSQPAQRHPLDPEPVRSTKAGAVLFLGVVAVLTGPLVGGIVPATIALVIGRQAYAELVSAQGYLTGERHLRIGLTLAVVGGVLALAAVVTASVIGLVGLVNGADQGFPSTSS
jgi:hypothetical protein